MRTLDKKLFRDIRRLWAQALAIALVIASGVATLILANGAYRSLEASRTAYYERNAFADVFANATRAPREVAQMAREIAGVAAVEARIVKYALLDVAGLAEPVTGVTISLPDHREPVLNKLHLRAGRLPEPGHSEEVAVNEAFALANRLGIGSTFHAILNGKKRALTIVGVALSPEYIYAIGPGDLMPDDSRFGVLWMPETALVSVFDLEGAFNSLVLKLQPGASEAEVVRRVDLLLESYGGTGAIVRKDQVSHAFIDAELKQLSALARVIPPIFLLVSAFLINITLMRLITLEREQIGLLKAVGYGRRTIAFHYIELVLLIGAGGIAIGFVAGAWLGRGLTRLYADFFHFPYLIFRHDADIYAMAALVSWVAAVAGALKAVLEVLRLAPAVAMQPPAPQRFKTLMAGGAPRRAASPLAAMAFRRMLRAPVRSGMTLLGLSLAVALLVTALQSFDSVELMIDIAFHRTDRQRASVSFTESAAPDALQAVARLPGVIRAEPFRYAPVRLRNGHVSRRLSITGKPAGMELSRVLDLDLKPVRLPAEGLVISERVAQILDLKRGDSVEIDVLEGKRMTVRAPVADVIKSYFGLMVYMDLAALDALLDIGPRLSGVHIDYDTQAAAPLYAALKATPAVASFAMQDRALRRFRETLAENITYMVTVYTALAVVIAFGVVYNSARIQLSERARELASLRVLGFSRSEVSEVLLSELLILTVLAVPLGWVIGYGFGWLVIQSFSSDLYRAPFTIAERTYAIAAIVVLVAAGVSAAIVRARVDRLDLIAVLKTRE